MKFDTLYTLLYETPMISLAGKDVMAGGNRLKGMSIEDISENIVFIRNDNPNGWTAEGFSLVYFMDSPESAQKIAKGEIPYLMIPRGTFYSGGNPITDVWKKKHQTAGQEHILGLIEANVMPDNIYIDMMSVRPKYKRNTINTLMINCIKQSYPKAKVTFSGPTDEGRKFIKSQKYDL